jgi:hypothetical protein
MARRGTTCGHRCVIGEHFGAKERGGKEELELRDRGVLVIALITQGNGYVRESAETA